jgi:hypothetical protein
LAAIAFSREEGTNKLLAIALSSGIYTNRSKIMAIPTNLIVEYLRSSSQMILLAFPSPYPIYLVALQLLSPIFPPVPEQLCDDVVSDRQKKTIMDFICKGQEGMQILV